ncbi:MAG: hypothetical protein IH845_02055 [Nanoarchaeota archaeon]|nr:hypothetical protein [Nanoarchaeota archaeon]
MNEAIKRGISFGLTSGIITTLGVMIGLNTGTGLRLAVIGGILTVAIADAFSDALGIHNSEECKLENDRKSIIQATVATFFTKLLIASSFLIPVILLPLPIAVIVNLIWGLIILTIFSYMVAKLRKEKPLRLIISHLATATLVIIITYFVGKFISAYFS